MRLSRRLQVLCSLVVMLVAGVTPARSADTVSFCFDEWPPYTSVSPQGATGISVDILSVAARRAGLTADFRELPWNRCLEMVRQGQVDAVTDAADRPEFVQTKNSFAYYSVTFWVRADSPVESLSFDDLAGRTIGLIDGYKYPEQLLEAIDDAGMTVDMSVDEGTVIRKLAFGRVDTMIGDRVVTRDFVTRHSLSLRPLTPDYSANALYPSFRPGRAELAAEIDAALGRMLDDGTVREIYARHLGPDGVPPLQ